MADRTRETIPDDRASVRRVYCTWNFLCLIKMHESADEQRDREGVYSWRSARYGGAKPEIPLWRTVAILFSIMWDTGSQCKSARRRLIICTRLNALHGITFDKMLSFDLHSQNVINDANQLIGLIKRVFLYSRIENRRLLQMTGPVSQKSALPLDFLASDRNAKSADERRDREGVYSWRRSARYGGAEPEITL